MGNIRGMNSVICKNEKEVRKVLDIMQKTTGGDVTDQGTKSILSDLADKGHVVIDNWYRSDDIGWCDFWWYVQEPDNRGREVGLTSAELFIKKHEQ